MKQMIFFKLLLASALVLALAACENISPVENPNEQGIQGGRTVKLGLQMEPGTKVTLSEAGKFAWEKDDQIDVWKKTSTTSGFHTYAVELDGSDKKISVNIEEGEERDKFAVYPSSLNPEYNTTTGLTITLPSSYTLNQVSGTKAPLPMVAVNDNAVNSLTFYNVGGALRLTVNNIPSDATGMDIQFPGKKVNGSFAVSNPGTSTSTISNASPADGEDKIRVTFDAGINTATVNIPLPTGVYGEVYVTPVGSSTKVAAIRNINSITAGQYAAVRANGKKLTTTMVSFSVAADKKVFFSPGNLVKTDATYTVGSGNETYAFETTPFNTNGGSLGYDQGTPTSESARGYFTWSEIATANETPRPFTVNGVSGWKAMTFDEWNYLLWEIYNSIDNNVYSGRNMNSGVNRFYVVDLGSDGDQVGMLLPPDQATASDVYMLEEDPDYITEDVEIETYLSRGFVFLPASGYCSVGTQGTYWLEAGECGYSWYTTEDEVNNTTAYCLQFYDCGCSEDRSKKTSIYCSVRLVHE